MAFRTLRSEGGPPRRRAITAPAAAATVIVAMLLLAPVLLPWPDAPDRGASPAASTPGIAEGPSARHDMLRAALPVPAPPVRWERDAPYVLEVLEAVMAGRGVDPFADARAEALRGSVVLFPPGAAELRMLLRGDLRDRTVALVAAAVRPPDDEALVELALRSLGEGAPSVVRLLGAELAAALPPERIARHEDALVRAFEAETDPLVLAVALPGLERLDAAPVARILRSQLPRATPEMRPVLLELAASRVGSEALEELEAATPGLGLRAR